MCRIEYLNVLAFMRKHYEKGVVTKYIIEPILYLSYCELSEFLELFELAFEYLDMKKTISFALFKLIPFFYGLFKTSTFFL